MTTATITLIGGPTALVELDGFRLLTDPTFDDPGEYTLPHTTLKKTAQPALRPDQIGAVDAILLSHDQHSDNLDTLGRAFLQKADRVFTTEAGAGRLGGNAQGLQPWATTELSNGNGGALDITATNISQVTIDARRAKVDCHAHLNLTSDGPLKVTLADCP